MTQLPGQTASPEIIAHRGASHKAPENSLAALRLAWEEGADAVEVDVHLSKDGYVVLMHDFSSQRTAGDARRVAEQSLAELKKLDIGSWKDPKWAGEQVPTLSEALATIPDGKRIFIEIKCGPEILPVLERDLKTATQKTEQMVLIAFDFETLRLAKKRLPGHQAYWLVSYKKDSLTGKYPDIFELKKQAGKAGLDGLNLDSQFPVDSGQIASIRSGGLRLFVWTVDDPVLAGKWARAGADGVTTNRPALLRAFRKS